MDVITEKSIGLDGEVFVERRNAIRRRILKGGVLSFNKGYSTFECVVRNVSDSGARISLGETFALPNAFKLHVDGSPARFAEICWRSPMALGVRFLSGPAN